MWKCKNCGSDDFDCEIKETYFGVKFNKSGYIQHNSDDEQVSIICNGCGNETNDEIGWIAEWVEE